MSISFFYVIIFLGDNMSNLFLSLINVSKNCGVADFSKDYNVMNTVRFAGYIIFFLEIAIPLIIIIVGTVDLGKAVISGDDKAVKDASTSIIKRIVAGIIIFFIPTVISLTTSAITSFTPVKSKYERLNSCLYHPFSSCELNITKCCVDLKPVDDINECK